MLLVGIAIIVACRTTNVVARVASGLGAAIVIVMVAFARVYRGLHHPTDVLFGVVLGLACLFVSARAVRAASREKERAGGRRIPTVFPTVFPTASHERSTAARCP